MSGTAMVDCQFKKVKYASKVAFCLPWDMKDGKRFICEWKDD